jgi:hypothetical protein
MSVEDLIGYSFVFLIVVVPLLGLTARLAIKPMVDAIVRLRESFIHGGGTGVVERRVLQLEEELQQLRLEVHRLREAEAFQRELLAVPSSPERTVSATANHCEPTHSRMVPQDRV